MEPVTWIIVIFLINLIIVALIPRPATPVPPQSPDTLTYCRTCGCNHRHQWMTWDNGDYRCTVCCTHL